MKKKAALNIAIDGIKHLIKEIAVDANLHDLIGADYPYAIKASEKKKLYLEAIKTLEEIKDNE